jgi:hypothetical protein
VLRIAALLCLIFSLTTCALSQSSRRGSWLRGTWEGKGYQTDSDTTWTMKLNTSGRKYSIEYPSLKCGGEWKLISLDSRRARFREKITYGLEECTNNGTIVVERLNRRQLLFLYNNWNSKEVVASVILNRKP